MWTSRRARLIAPWMGLVGLLALGVGCGGEDTCFTEYNCGPGRRCELGPNFTEGVCVACDPAEIPYDGLDNDCRTNTPDDDLDGDGDNSSRSRVRPGTDCDDNDPEVSGNVAESKRGTDESLCRDGKDNDCDQVVDELDCSDLTRPAVGFLTPTNGQGLSGRFVVQVSASDRPNETGVREVRLEVVGRAVLGTRMSPPYDFEIDTTQIPDGVIVLRATAVDGALRESSAEISVYVDNYSGPRIMLTLPSVGERRGGVVPIVAQAVDAVGVFDFAVEEQGTTLNRVQGGLLDLDLDTRMLRWPDGPRTLTLVARDNNGAETRLALPLEIDNTPPTLTLTPAAGGMPLTGLVEFVATAAGDDEIAWVDVAGRRTMGPATGRLEARVPFNTLALPNGPWVVTATAADTTPVSRTAVGNRAIVTRSYEVYNLENALPDVTYLTPVAGDEVLGSVYVRARIVHRVGLESASLKINGRTIQTISFATPVGEHAFSLYADFDDEPRMSEISVEATDVRGRSVRTAIPVVVNNSFRLDAARIVSGQHVAGGERPTALVDLDSDGRLDLITGVPLAVHFGLGDGRFEGPRPLLDAQGTSRNCNVIRVADINRDSLVDLTCQSQNSLIIATLVNARFARVNFSLLSSPMISHVLLDADLDGDLDIVCASGVALTSTMLPATELAVIENDGGVFGAPTAVPSGSGATFLSVADLDGDRDLDLVVSRRSGPNAGFVSSYIPSPTGLAHVSDIPLVGYMTTVPLVDYIDADPFPDVAVVECVNTGNQVVLARGDGSGRLTRVAGYVGIGSVVCSDLVMGDIDNDGSLEPMVRLGRRLRGFDPIRGVFGPSVVAGVGSRSELIVPNSPQSAPLVGDLDSDGALDIIDHTPDTLVVVKGRLGSPPFAEIGVVNDAFPTNAVEVRNVRVGPSRQPMALRVSQSPSGYIDLVGFRNGQLSVVQQMTVGQPVSCIDTAEVSDGTVEFAACAGRNVVFGRIGVGTATVTSSIDTGFVATEITMADVDSDGIDDLVTCDSASLSVIRRGSRGWSSPQSTPALTPCANLLVHDVDRNGVLDAIIYASRSEGALFALPVAGPPSAPIMLNLRSSRPFFLLSMPPLGSPPRLVQADAQSFITYSFDPVRGLVADTIYLREPEVSGFPVDANGDGLTDLVSGSLDSCLQNAGRFQCSEERYRTANHAVAVADYDGDGRIDLMTAAVRTLVMIPGR